MIDNICLKFDGFLDELRQIFIDLRLLDFNLYCYMLYIFDGTGVIN